MNNTLDIAGHVTTATGRATPPSRVVLVGARRDARPAGPSLGNRPWNGLPIVGFVDTGHPRSIELCGSGAATWRLHPETDPVPVLGSHRSTR